MELAGLVAALGLPAARQPMVGADRHLPVTRGNAHGVARADRRHPALAFLQALPQWITLALSGSIGALAPHRWIAVRHPGHRLDFQRADVDAPLGIFDSAERLDTSAYRSAIFDMDTDSTPLSATLVRFRATGFEPVELHWQIIGSRLYRVAYDRAGESRILPVSEGAQVLTQLPSITLEKAARAIHPQDVLEVEWLDAYDFYYFSRSEQSMYGAYRKRLPVVRVRFQDPAATWLHLDPHSGALIEQLDRRQRAERWLFNLLHSWDWLPLLERPWLRETLIILFSIGGLAISLTGIMLGWRRLFPRGKRKGTAAACSASSTQRRG